MGIATVGRSVVLAIILCIIGFGFWMVFTVDDVEIRGSLFLDTSRLSKLQIRKWRDFFFAAKASIGMIEIAIAFDCVACLISVLVLLSTQVNRLKVSHSLIFSAELSNLVLIAVAFATSLVFSLRLNPYCSGLTTSSTGELGITIEALCPISKTYFVANGTTWLIVIPLAYSSRKNACKHDKAKLSRPDPPRAPSVAEVRDIPSSRSSAAPLGTLSISNRPSSPIQSGYSAPPVSYASSMSSKPIHVTSETAEMKLGDENKSTKPPPFQAITLFTVDKSNEFLPETDNVRSPSVATRFSNAPYVSSSVSRTTSVPRSTFNNNSSEALPGTAV